MKIQQLTKKIKMKLIVSNKMPLRNETEFKLTLSNISEKSTP